MPNCQFMCLECGEVFDISTTTEDLDNELQVECPECGGTNTTRTYDEGSPVEAEDVEDKESDDDKLGDINLDEE